MIHVAKSIRPAVGRNVSLRCNEIFSKLNYMHEDCFFSLEKERERGRVCKVVKFSCVLFEYYVNNLYFMPRIAEFHR